MEAPRARGHRPCPLSSFSKGPHSSPLPPPSWRDRPEKSTDLFSLREALLLAQVLLSKHQVSDLKGSEPRSGLTWEKPSVLQLLASKQNPELSLIYWATARRSQSKVQSEEGFPSAPT